LFDCLVVALQVVDVIGTNLTVGTKPSAIGFVGTLRLLRLARVARIFRTFRLIPELRTMSQCIQGTMTSLCCCLVFIFLSVYVASLVLLQTVLNHQQAGADTLQGTFDVSPELTHWYGSLVRTMLTLYECINSGLSWDEALQPIIVGISPAAAVFFIFYIAFSLITLMNIVTSIVVEKVFSSAQTEHIKYMASLIGEAFTRADDDKSGQITLEEFADQLESFELQSYFRMIDVDPAEVSGLFSLLDADGSGSVDFMEFLSGCVRIQGAAKAIDLLLLIHENKHMNRWLRGQVAEIRSALDELGSHKGRSTPLHSRPHSPRVSRRMEI